VAIWEACQIIVENRKKFRKVFLLQEKVEKKDSSNGVSKLHEKLR
jgi:hypothetical protein